MRGRHAGALIISIAVSHCSGRSRIQRGQYAIWIIRKALRPAWGGDLHHITEVAIRAPAAGAIRGSNGDDACAVCRRVSRGIRILVSRSDYYNGSGSDYIVYGGLSRSTACSSCSQAEIQHLCRVCICWDTGHRQACGPARAVDGVRKITAALPEHADRKYLCCPVHAGHACVVIGHGADGACYVGAMPGTIDVYRCKTASTLTYRLPIARISGVVVPAVAVVRDEGVTDEVISWNDPPVAIKNITVNVCVRQQPCIDHCNYNTG